MKSGTELEAEAKALLIPLLDRKAAGGTISPRERLAIPAQEMPAQDPAARGRNVAEVALGYGEAQARLEAERCLGCKNEPCVGGCPVQVPIPRFIAEIQRGDFKAAVDVIKETNLLPAVCGRVCPQEKQCQALCTVGKSLKDTEKAVAIGRLERFAAGWERSKGKVTVPAVKPPTGKKVAIVGPGPAGLTVAADTAREGHGVTIFEAFHKTGGVMVYGIPEFRLPKSIVQEEVNLLEKMGVKFELGEPDDSGRRSPVPVPGSEYIFDCDTVIVALGNESNPLLAKTTAALKADRRGRIIVDDEQKTSLDKVYAGGDIVLGAATVILAMGEGRRAAAAINKLLAAS
jgi:glutamate synthase (NADPH/NADH) small chain